MALTVEASAGAAMAVESEDGSKVLAITPPQEVTLTVTAPGGTTADLVSVTKDGAAFPVTFAPAPNVAGATAAGMPAASTAALVGSFTAADETAFGTYVVTVGTDSATVVLRAAETEGDEPAETPPEEVIEVQPGVYDREFALATGIAAAILSVLIVVGTLVMMGRFSLEAAQATITEGWVTNTLSERVAGVVQLGALAVGGVLLFLGAWQAALEVRGRLSAQVTAAGEPVERGVEDGDLGESVAKVVDSLRRARGTIATLTVGTVVILGSLWSAAHVASSSHGPEPAATQSASPTSTESPGAGGASPTATPTPSLTPSPS
jgi:hypothetical protein